MNLAQGSYFGRRKPEDGRIDWRAAAQQIHALIRAVAPPFPGAFTDLPAGRLIFSGSHWCGEESTHPSLAPCLYVEDGKLYLDCSDGVRLGITGVTLNEAALDAEAFRRRYADTPLALAVVASRRTIQL
jgi:methionyl-tRNA formyltransferase